MTRHHPLPITGLLALLLLSLASMAWSQEPAVPAAQPIQEVDQDYRLGPGDVVQINVFNQEDLTGQYKLDGAGRISMHLIGQLKASDLTATELEAELVSRLRPDYLVNPRISVIVLSYRPYYIIGEVNRTGTFPYVDGMSYLTAIAIAGGYTYRAKKDVVFVIRGEDLDREEIRIDVDEKVQPGDIIRVAERLF
jgi:polysaccharide export outer membrane protein